MRKKTAVYPAKNFMSNRRLGIWSSGPFDISPDGKEIIFVCDMAGSMDLWKLGSPRGWPRQLTFNGDMIYELSFSPDGRWITFAKDNHGDENYQIYIVGSSGGEAFKISQADSARHYLGSWSKDSRGIYFTSNARDPKTFDLYYYDCQYQHAQVLTTHEQTGTYQIVGINAKEDTLFYTFSPTNSRQELWELNLRTGKKRLLFPASESIEAVVRNVCWIEKTKTIWLLSDYQRDCVGIGKLDYKTGRFEYFHAPNREVDAMALASDGSWITWAQNVDGYTRYDFMRLPSKQRVQFPWPRKGSIVPGVVGTSYAVSKNDRFITLLWSSPTRVSEIYRLDLKNKKLEQWTQCQSSNIAPGDLVHPKLYKYQSFDQRPVSGFLYLPKNGPKPYQTIVWPHGGPESQFRASFNSRVQFYVNHGWAVFAPNFRGSTGYGKEFRKLIYKDWGGGHYQDVLAGTKSLITGGIIDAERVAIAGGSFGGYSVLWAITQNPELWRAAVDIFGISNLVTLAKNDPPEWEPWIRAMVGDWRVKADEEAMIERSPITHVDRIACPLLVFQGAKDFRVRKEESDQIVEALKARKVPVEYILYPDEGHGWAKTEHLLEELEKTLSFLETHIGRRAQKKLAETVSL